MKPTEIFRESGFINSNIHAIKRKVSNININCNKIESLYSTLFGAFPQEFSAPSSPGNADSNLESQLNSTVQELELAMERLSCAINLLVEHPL